MSVEARHHIEEVLLAICRRVLKQEHVRLDRGFFEQGGDSLSMIHYIAEIMRAFEVGLSPAAVLEAASIGDVKNLIVERIAAGESRPLDEPGPLAELRRRVRPRQEVVCGPVPLVANRHSYFLKRKRNLGYWNVTPGILEVKGGIDEAALRAAVQELAAHHDGLRLQAYEEDGEWRQVIVAPEEVDPLVTVTCAGPDLDRFVEEEVNRIHNQFTFPGELLKVLHIRHAGSNLSLLTIVAHHMLADAVTFQLMLGDFFDLYRRRKAGDATPLPPKTTSFLDYSLCSNEYWSLCAEEEMAYWQSLPWGEVRPLPVDHEAGEEANAEGHTTYAVESIAVEDQVAFLQRFRGGRYDFVDLVLAAITTAYGHWTGHDILHLAMVFHGRESFLEGVDLTRTAGWISETVPLLLPTSGPLRERLEKIHEQRETAAVRGKSYGVLRYIADNETIRSRMSEHPLPDVSLNVVMPAFYARSYSDVAVPCSRYASVAPNKDSTARVFLLSGGVFFRDRNLHVSWDFSDKILDRATVEPFTAECMAQIERLASAWSELQ